MGGDNPKVFDLAERFVDISVIVEPLVSGGAGLTYRVYA
jgi:hypothetical protein